MKDVHFNLSHRRLFDMQGEGLHAVWRRAACNRQEDDMPCEPAATGADLLRWMLPAVAVVAIVGCLLPVFL
jgi:hypothetical protein